ncbi:hypothetical protein [Natronosalvus caseinilyticus]|uniref:hypothetical protein n=1 Tax=Natronosalvus caseinilyticus TaxID=2953747 RepID=UPI0028AC8820|nr:hypothetical protein [Natronosalvus caseinilyticus]
MPGAPSSRDQKTEQVESPSLDFFFATNYELFAILGLFAALSVYLTQLPDEMSIEVQAGIGGSLIIFVIIAFVVINKASNCASYALAQGQFLRFSAYIVIMFCLGSLILSVVSVMNRYSEGTVPLIDYSMTFGFSISYISFVQKDGAVIKYDGGSLLENLIPYSPYLAAALLSVWHLQTGVFDESIRAAQDEVMFGVVIGLALVHFFTSIVIGTSMIYVDRAGERILSTQLFERTYFKR